MNKNEILIELLKHMEWADSVAWNSIINFPSAGNDYRLKEILFHYHRVQQVYLQIWNKQAINGTYNYNQESSKSILNKVIRYYSNLNKFIDNIDKYDLDRIIIVPWADNLTKILGKPPEKVNLTETVLQVAVHSSHHRGQVNKRLRELGGEPKTIDLVAWGWMGKPKADWKNKKEQL